MSTLEGVSPSYISNRDKKVRLSFCVLRLRANSSSDHDVNGHHDFADFSVDVFVRRGMRRSLILFGRPDACQKVDAERPEKR